MDGEPRETESKKDKHGWYNSYYCYNCLQKKIENEIQEDKKLLENLKKLIKQFENIKIQKPKRINPKTKKNDKDGKNSEEELLKTPAGEYIPYEF